MANEPGKEDLFEKKPIPLKWVLVAVAAFALLYHLSLWWQSRGG